MKKQSLAAVETSNLQRLLLRGSIKELFIAINKLLTEGGDKFLLPLNAFLSDRFNLYLLIQHTLKNIELLREVQNESYYHENGFHKIVLGFGKAFKLRLHHFGAATKIPMENIHDHRWAFASTILSGCLKMDLFAVGEDEGEELLHYRYDAGKTNGAYGVEPLGYTRLKIQETKAYCSGQQYLMTTTQLHRITNVSGEESITVILTGPPKGNTCNLYAKRVIEEEEKSPLKYEQRVLKNMLIQLSQKIYPILN